MPLKFPIQLLLPTLLIVLTGSTGLFAQAPPVIWQKCYGGDSADVINCIKQTSDLGFIAVGSTQSTNGDLAGNGGVTGLWVIKLDPVGNITWEKTYNDTLLYGSYIEQTNDGGIYTYRP